MSTAAPCPDPVSTGNIPLPTPEQLPDDPETLKRLLVELMATLREERRDKEALQHRLHLLLQRLYGPRSERFHPDQLLLFAEGATSNDPAAASAAAAEAAESPSQRRRSEPHGRGQLSENLPRRPVHHRLSEAERLCVCGEVRVEIGADVSEQLDYQPASLFVSQHWTHKYLCPRCRGKTSEPATHTEPITAMTEPTTHTPARAATEPAPATTEPAADSASTEPTTDSAKAAASAAAPPATAAAGPIGPAVVSAAKPPMPIAKGLPGPGLLAFVIVGKYFDHLPLHRQENILARQGASISRSTLCDWMAASAELLRPLYDLLAASVLQSQWLHTDDTPVKNQGHAPGATALSRFWIYWGDRSHPYNVFDFTINRKRDGPQSFLADFHGYLHADAFTGYDALYLPGPRAGAAPILEVACNAHARRKFHEARGSDALRSHLALAYYAQLYELERAAKANHFDDDQVLRMRQDLSVPILDKFHTWLQEQRLQVLPKSPMAEAIGYALNQWEALRRYTEAGFLSIDNNVAEREMKRIAIGRKNWLFVGSDKGGRTAAVLFSFTSTCHRLGIEPWAYLQDVLTRLPALPAERRAELLPDRWQAARPPAAPPGATLASAPPPDSTA